MIVLRLNKTQDPDNVINKALTDPLPINILLRADTDVINPMIMLARMPGIDYTDYNYAYIAELKHFYFIREYRVVNATLVQLGLELDYLETYKDKILASTASYRRVARAGDYGDIKPDFTGRSTVVNYKSTVTLEAADGGILSLIKPE